MRPRQFVTWVALCGAVPLTASGAAKLSFGSFAVDNSATAARDATSGAISLSPEADALDAAPVTVTGSLGDAATSVPEDSAQPAIVSADAPAAETPVVEAPLPDSRPTPLPETPVRLALALPSDPDATERASVLAAPPAAEAPAVEAATRDPDSIGQTSALAGASAADTPVVEAASLDSAPKPAPEKPVRLVSAFPSRAVNDDPMPAVQPVKPPNECLVADICIDEYLWSLYERTPKLDTNKETERIKKTVKKKGKVRTVISTIVKYVLGDFTWKDPVAAQRANMSVKDYVIGGMDRGFKLKLYHALRAMDEAGLMPGITSAFRDDYRQAIATGNKAASDSSYHGGSRRGGYGHGLAADLVSVKGNTRMERYAASDELWKWIDAHDKELGIGRPYRDRDPPHVGAIDGREYIVKRALSAEKKPGKTKPAQTAKLQTKKHPRTARDNPGATKRGRPGNGKMVRAQFFDTRSTGFDLSRAG
jgi:hypothetical protein